MVANADETFPDPKLTVASPPKCAGLLSVPGQLRFAPLVLVIGPTLMVNWWSRSALAVVGIVYLFAILSLLTPPVQRKYGSMKCPTCELR